MDPFSVNKRKQIMRANRPRGNFSTELALISLLRNNNITGWRRKFPLLGSPDFVFQAHRIAIFVDGCFWHGHDCRRLTPSSNVAYWSQKMSYNLKHVRQVNRVLRASGWNVLRIWECALKKQPARVARRIETALSKDKTM